MFFNFRCAIFTCVRVFRACALFAIHFILFLFFTPGVVWGALGGRWPLLEGFGEILSPTLLGDFSELFLGLFFPPALAGGIIGGCPPVQLLDIYRWTDTSRVFWLVSFYGL